MNNKINNLSSLISTDKNIHQNVSNLFEFKEKIEKEFMVQKLTIKNINKELKDSINNYNKIISESIIYPGVIGPKSKFSTFHELIDYTLLNINQMLIIKDKNILDFKSYKTKLESLIKSFKNQTDSIMMNSTEFTNKKIEGFEKKLQGLLSNQESKLLDLKIENSKLNMLLENYLDKFNNIGIEFENHKNESKFIKNKVNYLNDFIKFLKYRMDEGELIFEKNKKRKISDNLQEMEC